MFCASYFIVILFTIAFWQTTSIAAGQETTADDKGAEIFGKYHTSVVTVNAFVLLNEQNKLLTGAGFIMDFAFINSKKNKVLIVITAGHVLRGAYKVNVLLYQNEKDVTNGKWKTQECRANVHGFDVVRDVAMLSIICDRECDCTDFKVLNLRRSSVSEGELVLIIGDSSARLVPHSIVDGRLSSTNITFTLATATYKNINGETTFASRVHILTGNINKGDSGSAVMDKAGNVIGMMLGSSGDVKYCITVPEIFKAYEQILDAKIPRFVGCTSHESVLLGKIYWENSSGKSIQEMNAIATAVNARYIAIAHDDVQAHAFTFHALWYEIFSGEYYIYEYDSECLCEMNSFSDGRFLRPIEDGKEMCGCSENACRRKEHYERRFGEDNDRRWAVYQRETTNKEKPGHYVASKESLLVMRDLANEIAHWKEKFIICSDFVQTKIKNETEQMGKCEKRADGMKNEKEKYKTYLAIAIAVVVCLVVALFLRVRGNKDLEKRLKEATTEFERLRAELAEREPFQDIQEAN